MVERSGKRDPDVSAAWPSLPLLEWQATRDTLTLWTQVVGKVRMAHTPLINHWWNVTLYVTARGLTTSVMPVSDGRGLEIEFDFTSDQLVFSVTDGTTRALPLEPQAVAEFYERVMRALDELGCATPIWTMPVEIEGAIPFTDDHEHTTYDATHARAFWLALVQSERVLQRFRARFLGKVSPVHFFWGGADLAVTRFSGRGAPRFPRRVPNCGPFVMEEAYSHEVSSCGYWPGPTGEGIFYSYAYPEPAGYRDGAVSEPARYDEELGEFVLPYEAVRTSGDPDGVLLAFLQSTYEAAADHGAWDRAHLERARSPDEPGQ